MWRNRSVAETTGIESISRNRSFATALQVHHLPIAITPKQSFAGDNLSLNVAVGSAAKRSVTNGGFLEVQFNTFWTNEFRPRRSFIFRRRSDVPGHAKAVTVASRV